MRKTLRIRDFLPQVTNLGYLPAEAKKILIKSFDAVVRAFHVTALTVINKIKFLKYSNAVVNSLEARIKRDYQDARRTSDQLRTTIKQSTEIEKINDYMKEKFARVLSLKSGSVIIFQYTDLNNRVTNRMGFVVGGSEGPDKVFFTSKEGEVFVKVIDITGVEMSYVYSLIKIKNDIKNLDKGQSTSVTFTDAITNPEYKGILSYDKFRSFNANKISYLSTLNLETIKT